MDASWAGLRPPAPGSPYARAMAFLGGLGRFGVRLGLQRMEAMLAALGHPERRIPHVVHVAGTNGKGSVAAMVASILHAAGRRTGLYTSPHLVDTTERFRVAGRAVTRAALAAALEAVRPHAEALAAAGDPPTPFEVLTAAGYRLFAAAGVEWLVQEVGLGGRLDATNVLERTDVSVITPVGLDHTERLGSTVTAIAREKAGILRPGTPLVTAAQGQALAAIRARARALGVPVVRVAPAGVRAGGPPGERQVRVRVRSTDLRGTRFDLEGDLGRLDDLFVPLPGAHQAVNGAAAVATAWLVREAAGVDEEALRAGLAATRWPGRLECLHRRPPVVLDGAHNEDGMRALLRALGDLFPGRPVTLVFGVLKDKERVFEVLARRPADVRLARALTVTPYHRSRALPAAESARRLVAAGIPAEPVDDAVVAVDRAVALARADEPPGAVCVCGSLFLVGEVRGRWPELRRRWEAGRARAPAGARVAPARALRDPGLG